MTFLRFLMLLALAVWLGALIFFPVVAQTAFTELPSTHLAGSIVHGTLITLHKMAFISGAIFLMSSLLYNRIAHGTARTLSLSNVLVVGMLALTAISQFQVIPKMDTLRAAGEISTLPADNPIRHQFDSLHSWSTNLEGTVLILGLIVLYSTARRFKSSD
jgi:multidrug efflux pump subunit AcrB